MSNISSVLQKLDKVLKKKGEQKPKVDYKELNKLKEKSFFKFSPGKNYIALVPLNENDPFAFWAYHKGLGTETFHSVQCDAYNKEGGSCVVCEVIADMEKDDKKGNYNLINPIKQQFEFYVPIINMESEETIAEGLKWLKFGPAIMGYFQTWMSDVDEDAGETPFYSLTVPMKVTVTYNKGAASPQDVYKVSNKPMKAFSKSQIEEWQAGLPDFKDFMFIKPQDQIQKLVENYFQKVADELTKSSVKKEEKDTPNDYEEGEKDDHTGDKEVVSEVPQKLDFLKKKKVS